MQGVNCNSSFSETPSRTNTKERVLPRPSLPPSFSTPGFAAALALPQKSPQRWREHPFPSLFPPFSNRVRVPYGRFLLAPLVAIHKRRQQSGGRGAGQLLTKGCVNLVSLEGVQNPQILTDVICERHFLSLLAHYMRHSPLMIGGGDTDGRRHFIKS